MADAPAVGAPQVLPPLGIIDGCPDGVFLRLFQKLQDQGHAHVLAVEGLAEIGGPGVVIHLYADLIDPGQGVQDAHSFLCQLHFFLCQDVAVL